MQAASDTADTSVMQSPRYVARAAAKRELVARRFGAETLLVPVCAGVGDLDSVYTLNELGTAIWETLDQPMEIRALAERVAREYDVPVETAARDIAAYLEDLAALDLVVFPAAVQREEPARP